MNDGALSPAPEPLVLRCACGRWRGTFLAHPRAGARGICHCDDCRRYGLWLGRDDILDANGGTEVVQTWPALVRVEAGAEETRLLRLTSKGLFRWFAGCCRAPLGNTMGKPKLPFVGLIAARVEDRDALTRIFGAPRGVQGRFAPGGCPPGVHRSAPPDVIAGAIGLLARGWWHAGHTPHPFFATDGRAVAAAQVLDPD